LVVYRITVEADARLSKYYIIPVLTSLTAYAVVVVAGAGAAVAVQAN